MKSDDEMKLTAYALGELDEAERTAVEARIWNDDKARAEVEKIRDMAKLLSDELAAEPVPVSRAIDVAQLQQRRRRLRWGGRLAIAAAVSVVAGGLAYSVLLVAWLRMDAMQAAAIMAAFGLGTLPAVLASAFGTGAILRALTHRGWRSAAASVLLLAGALTAAGPALIARAGHAVHGLVLDCVTY